jgi:AcrR family transcriptional regulator
MSTARPQPDSRGQRGEATRTSLITAARSLFVAKGYFATGTEEIVTVADVGTRGALYHHFADKRDLFLAVFDQVQAELASSTRLNPHDDALDTLINALQQFLDASANNPDVQQIVLIDGPAVLGWDQWRALEGKYGLGAITAMLNAAVAQGVIARQATEPLAHMLLSAVDEAALYIANSTNRQLARRQARASLKALLGGLRREAVH